MPCPGCEAGIPWTWLPYRTPFHAWNDHKTVCENYMKKPDFKCYDIDELDYDKLDPGVRDVVRWLVDEGFEPTDSGDGKYKLEHGWTEEEIVPFPHVYIQVKPESMISEAGRLRQDLWSHHGISLEDGFNEDMKPYIEVLYYPGGRFDSEGTAIIGLFNVDDSLLKKH